MLVGILENRYGSQYNGFPKISVSQSPEPKGIDKCDKRWGLWNGKISLDYPGGSNLPTWVLENTELFLIVVRGKNERRKKKSTFLTLMKQGAPKSMTVSSFRRKRERNRFFHGASSKERSPTDILILAQCFCVELPIYRTVGYKICVV